MITGLGPGVPGAAGVALIDVAGRPTVTGGQGQQLTKIITDEVLDAPPFSVLHVHMPPGVHSKPHIHRHSPIAIHVTDGQAVTLVGDTLEGAVYHGAGEWVYVPAGVPHLAVNASLVYPVSGIEVRSDPTGDDDTEVCADLVELAAARVQAIRERGNR